MTALRVKVGSLRTFNLSYTIKADGLIACRVIQFFYEFVTVKTTHKNFIKRWCKVKVLN